MSAYDAYYEGKLVDYEYPDALIKEAIARIPKNFLNILFLCDVIGFLINPVAGMGGAVGLKGTDGNVEEARRRGASPLAENRALITLILLARESGYNVCYLFRSDGRGCSS